MLHQHDHTHPTRDAAERRDPTGTAQIRRKFDREAVRRFRRLKGLVRNVVGEMDVLALKGVTTDSLDFVKLYGSNGTHDGLGERSRAFIAWLREAMSGTVIGAESGYRTSPATAWTNMPVSAAYRKGGGDAVVRLKRMGKQTEDFSFNNAIHFHQLSVLQKRTYDEMVNVCDTTIQQMSRVVGAGLERKLTNQQMVSALLDRIDKIGITRARLVASFEAVASYNDAALNVFDQGGVKLVGVIPEYIEMRRAPVTDADDDEEDERAPKPDYGPEVYKRGPNKNTPKKTKGWPKGRWPKVEWATAGDAFVCPECEALEGQVFTLQTARGMLPLHPNCRCALFPVDDDEEAEDE